MPHHAYVKLPKGIGQVHSRLMDKPSVNDGFFIYFLGNPVVHWIDLGHF